MSVQCWKTKMTSFDITSKEKENVSPRAISRPTELHSSLDELEVHSIVGTFHDRKTKREMEQLLQTKSQ